MVHPDDDPDEKNVMIMMVILWWKLSCYEVYLEMNVFFFLYILFFHVKKSIYFP